MRGHRPAAGDVRWVVSSQAKTSKSNSLYLKLEVQIEAFVSAFIVAENSFVEAVEAKLWYTKRGFFQKVLTMS